jgi:hypothetical protein
MVEERRMVKKNTMQPATNDAQAHKFNKAQKGAGIRSNLNFYVVLWTVGEKKHSINSPINLEI